MEPAENTAATEVGQGNAAEADGETKRKRSGAPRPLSHIRRANDAAMAMSVPLSDSEVEDTRAMPKSQRKRRKTGKLERAARREAAETPGKDSSAAAAAATAAAAAAETAAAAAEAAAAAARTAAAAAQSALAAARSAAETAAGKEATVSPPPPEEARQAYRPHFGAV